MQKSRNLYPSVLIDSPLSAVPRSIESRSDDPCPSPEGLTPNQKGKNMIYEEEKEALQLAIQCMEEQLDLPNASVYKDDDSLEDAISDRQIALPILESFLERLPVTNQFNS
jgi:hypothetical protein